MPFKPGHPKYGGRQVGTPNKLAKTTAGTIEQKCLEAGLDVIAMFIAIAQDASNDLRIRVDVLKELSSYMYAKKKSIEHSLKDMTDQELAIEAKARLEQRIKDTNS